MDQLIDFKTWPRYDHFKAFSAMNDPHFAVCFAVDAGPLLEKRRDNLFPAVLYLVHQACQEIPEFRCRVLRDGSVMRYERLDLSFNVLADDQLFSNHRFSPPSNFREFCEDVRRAVDAKNRKGKIEIDPEQGQDVLLTSYLPWFSFTGLREPSFDRNDSIPRVTWGKCNLRGEIPFSVQAHHGLLDGVHVGRFYAGLNKKISEFARVP